MTMFLTIGTVTEIHTQSKASKPKYRTRYLGILFFFLGALLRIFFWDIVLRRLGLRGLSTRTAPQRYVQIARGFRELATRLGGVWIKVGQFLSSRLDVLPESITDELADLQDEVHPESFEVMKAVIEDAFHRPLEDTFATFDAQALASASLGQTHRASLPSGESVVVKIQRAYIHSLLRVDLAALMRVIRWLKRYRPLTRRADLDALYTEFTQTLWEEVDYIKEADNARRLAEMFAEDPEIHIPLVYSAYTTKNVLTLEDVYFIKVTDYAVIEAAGIDRKEVATRLFRTYLKQIFEEGFFHADPHPGNLFVEPLNEGDWRLVFVDFGMVGQVTPKIKAGLRDLAIAFGTRDLDRLMQAFSTLDIYLPEADIDRVRQAEADLFNRMWGKDMHELIRTHPLEMREFADEFRDLLYEMPFQVPSNMIYLGRCVAILSGMCTGLDPEFNLFQEIRPFAEKLISEEGDQWLEELFDRLASMGRTLWTLPPRLDSALSQIERGELSVRARASGALEAQLKGLTFAIHRLVAAGIFAGSLVAGSLLFTRGYPVLGGIGFTLALLALVWVVAGPVIRKP
jgi:predicted unusual protein kinase regulating ubiquinone biosynthesis (AarF/ABC1/UbiB family)